MYPLTPNINRAVSTGLFEKNVYGFYRTLLDKIYNGH